MNIESNENCGLIYIKAFMPKELVQIGRLMERIKGASISDFNEPDKPSRLLTCEAKNLIEALLK